MNLKLTLLLSSIVGLLIPCCVQAQDYPYDLPYRYVAPPVAKEPASSPVPKANAPAPRPRARGSLYSDAGFQALTSDKRSFQVGETVTVMVYEDSSARSTADTGTARDTNVGLGVSIPKWNKSAGVTANNDFTGSGRTQRAGQVLAQLTVVVKEILANGDLLIAGEQQLEINGEKQRIRVEGRARPKDINEQNVILSTRLADARLAFVGNGVLGDQQQPRWWQRVLGLFGL